MGHNKCRNQIKVATGWYRFSWNLAAKTVQQLYKVIYSTLWWFGIYTMLTTTELSNKISKMHGIIVASNGKAISAIS